MKIKCIKTVIMKGGNEEQAFTLGKYYKIPDNPPYHAIDDLSQEHGLGGPGDEWFDEHFKSADELYVLQGI